MNAKTATDLVRKFADAWARCDVDAVIAMLAPGIIYQHPPLQAVVGHEAVRALITPNMTAAQTITWEFMAIESDAVGRQVMTERVDHFQFPEGVVAVPLMGIFEIENGLIAKWREYADIQSFLQSLKAIGRGSPVENLT